MKNLYVVTGLCIILTSACAPRRDLVYFSDLSRKTATERSISNQFEPRIQNGDVLTITVSTQSAESNVLFASNTNATRYNAMERDGYRVDRSGLINFPVIGAMKVEGYTLEEAQQKLSHEIDKYAKEPIVNVQFANFKITVMGEVNRPSSFTVTSERINLLEALGMAGDMTVYGKRENVLLIREVAGKRTVIRMNLNKQDVLNSPYFYLKQNDIVYVEPDKAKAVEYSPNNRLMPLLVATISAVAVLATTFIGRN
ncbi:polysaccharide biosynthesis/export family protein [Pedobacter sp. SYSU D00535]|uniref:polysaccharide biosynthesis/export family protein n=1 Tax=Pedobacter sp. SYSU D00535 TaxID=2810308 RepID=UPI001A95A562|nr:polysaccharide biosynthesis/export family protein [Pedobacter sp. SYSU D00535]